MASPIAIQVAGSLVCFVLGTAVGSFLNVCIWRLPRDGSLIFPPSHCPRCQIRLQAGDLVPLASFLALGRKCRYCARAISWRYFWVELITGCLFVAIWLRYGLSWELAPYLAFIAILIAAFFIDLDYMIIPDQLSLAGVGLGVAKNLVDVFFRDQGYLSLRIPGTAWVFSKVPESLVAIILVVALFWGINLLSRLLFRREGMGGGDFKLAAAIGAILGLKLAFLVVVLAIAAGAIYGILSILSKLVLRRYQPLAYMPFGPFLAIAALAVLLAPQAMAQGVSSLWLWWLSIWLP